MEYEYQLLKSFVEKKNGIKLYRGFLLNCISGIEYFNDKHDPFAFDLNGWSDHMSLEVDNFDDVLGEIYELYKGTGKNMHPLAKLFMLIVLSGSSFHFTKSQLKNSQPNSLGTMGAGMSTMPTKFASNLMSSNESKKFMTPQEQHIENLKKQHEEMERNQKLNQRNFQQPQYQQQNQPQQPTNETKTPTPTVKNNNKVKNILDKLNSVENDTTETNDETTSNNDRLVNTSEKKKRKKKSSIKIT
jgi:hypothetical protein